MMTTKNSRIKSKNADRLSTLPSEILANILSRLPIKGAVSTSVLSKRWQNLWTHITSCKLVRNYGGNFFAVANKILLKLASLELDMVQLYIPSLGDELDDMSYTYFLDIWVPLICDRHVKVLSIDVYVTYGVRPSILLQPCVFETRSLVSLELGGFQYRLPKNPSLPNLKKLLMFLYMRDDSQREFLEKLLKVCPVLVDLRLVQIHGFYKVNNQEQESCITISAKHLENLHLTISNKGVLDKVIIDAPNLLCIKILDPSLSRICFVKAPLGLIAAKMDQCLENQFDALDLFRNISSIESITLPDNVIRPLENLDETVPLVLQKLTKLTIWVTESSKFSTRLVRFLHYCPNLKVITLDFKSTTATSEDNNAVMDNIKPPSCLLREVETIKLVNIKESKHELELLKFILSHAPALKLLNVEVCSSSSSSNKAVVKPGDEGKFCNELFKFRGSCVDCLIRFSGKYLSLSCKTGQIHEIAFVK